MNWMLNAAKCQVEGERKRGRDREEKRVVREARGGQQLWPVCYQSQCIHWAFIVSVVCMRSINLCITFALPRPLLPLLPFTPYSYFPFNLHAILKRFVYCSILFWHFLFNSIAFHLILWQLHRNDLSKCQIIMQNKCNFAWQLLYYEYMTDSRARWDVYDRCMDTLEGSKGICLKLRFMFI